MFLVTTQNDHAKKSAKSAREAAVRSFLTTRQHAQRHAQDGGLHVKAAVHTPTRPIRGLSSCGKFDQHVPRLPHNKIDVQGESLVHHKRTVEKRDMKEDLSFDDLFDIFGPLLEEDASSEPGNALLRQSESEERCGEMGASISATERGKDNATMQGLGLQALQADEQLTFSDFVQPVPQITDSHITSHRFGRLALNVTKEEESLLHFYLSRGRCWLLGTSIKPQRCVALDVAQTFLESDPIYILAHVIIGELFYSKMTQRPLRPHYYSRSAQMYKNVRDLLTNNHTTFHRKLWALIQLTMLEHTAQRPDLQAMHAQAIDEFVQANGGTRALLCRSAKDDPVELNCRLFAVQFVRSGTFKPTFAQISTASTSFFMLLRLMRVCASRSRRSSSPPNGEPNSLLSPMVDYLCHLLRKWDADKHSTTAFQDNMGALVCVFSLALTIVEHDLTNGSVILYLHRTQESMQRSTTIIRLVGRELENLHPVAAAYIFGQVRSEIFPDNAEELEMRISERLVDVQRTCALLAETRRIEITGQVLQFVLYMTGMAAYRSERTISVLKWDFLDGLRMEIDAECYKIRHAEMKE